MIVVTGLMRSGTSILSEKLHRIGVPMGTMMLFPKAGDSAGVEWEDVEFSIPLASLLSGTKSFDVSEFFRGYIQKRSGDPVWGVKSPFLLPFLHEFKRCAGESGQSVTVILTKREFSETLKSLEQRVAHLQRAERRRMFRLAERVQKQIAAHWDEHEDGSEVFDIRDTIADLSLVEERLEGIVESVSAGGIG